MRIEKENQKLLNLQSEMAGQMFFAGNSLASGPQVCFSTVINHEGEFLLAVAFPAFR